MSKRFLLTALALIALALAAIAGLGVLLDPYAIFGTPRIAGLTAVKPYAATYDHISKPYAVSRSDAGTLVTGSSLTTYGIDPASPAWGAAPRPIYNLGLKGSTLADQRTLLLHALATTHPKLVVIVLSFEDVLDLLGDNASPQADFYRRLRIRPDGSPNPQFSQQRLRDMANGALTLQSLQDDATSILAQSSPVPDQGPDGFERHGPEERYLIENGARASLERRNDETARRIARWRQAPNGPPNGPLAPLDDMIAAARHAGADPIVLIAPTYAAEWELRRQTGILDQVDDWMRHVTAITEAAHVPLWDFSALSPETSEPYPAQPPLDGFIDTVHFRPALGAQAIARIMGQTPGPFGTRLDTTTLAPLIATNRAHEARWAATNPAAVTSIATSITRANDAECQAHLPACTRAGTAP